VQNEKQHPPLDGKTGGKAGGGQATKGRVITPEKKTVPAERKKGLPLKNGGVDKGAFDDTTDASRKKGRFRGGNRKRGQKTPNGRFTSTIREKKGPRPKKGPKWRLSTQKSESV